MRAGSAETFPKSFGDLLRHVRIARGMTQEQLAERSGLSARGISDLERGLHARPQRATLQLLIGALALAADERQAFLAAARSEAATRAARRPAATVSRAPTFALPQPSHPLIDREDELARIETVLRAQSDRLLTLSGPPGVGKTRLAIEAARTLGDAFPDGVVFVDLAPLTDAGFVAQSVASALGISDSPRRTLDDAVGGHLAGKRLLLVMDNFEHVLDAARLLPAWLRDGLTVSVLATSREPLRLRGEKVFLAAAPGARWQRGGRCPGDGTTASGGPVRGTSARGVPGLRVE